MAHAAVNETMDKTTDLTQKFKGRIKKVEDSLEKISHEAGEKVGETAAEVADSFSEYAEKGRQYFKKHPGRGLISVAVAGFAVGCLAAIAMRRRE